MPSRCAEKQTGAQHNSVPRARRRSMRSCWCLLASRWSRGWIDQCAILAQPRHTHESTTFNPCPPGALASVHRQTGKSRNWRPGGSKGPVKGPTDATVVLGPVLDLATRACSCCCSWSRLDCPGVRLPGSSFFLPPSYLPALVSRPLNIILIRFKCGPTADAKCLMFTTYLRLWLP